MELSCKPEGRWCVCVEVYLDDGDDVGCRVWELGHVHREVPQLVPLRLFQH